MPAQDTSDIKEKIILFLKQKGPSLPVHIAKEIGSSILFTSAFLSELLSEKRLKMSNMRIGSSPLFFIQEQEPMLEKFSHYLKSREKDAFTILKEKKFLKDSEQEPAIRVALREIKDFATPFKKNGEIIWKFFTIPETEFATEEMPKPLSEEKPSLLSIEKAIEKETSPAIFESVKEVKKAKEKKKAKTTRKKVSSKTKTDEKFLVKVKEFLSKNSIEIIGIEGLKKDEILLKVKNSGGEQLLVAYKKKKISEKEIIKASKKAAELKMDYSILSMGELPKKISELKEALQNLKDIGKVE